MEFNRYANPQQNVRDIGAGFIAAEWSWDCEWVDLPNGFKAPREWMFFDATGPRGAPMFIVECRIDEGGVPRVVTVVASSRAGGREVQASDLRRMRPLSDVIQDSLQLVVPPRARQGSTVAVRDLVAEAREEAADSRDLRHTARGIRLQDRRRFTEDMAEQVAQVYVDNIESGMPTKAVREHFGIATSTASLYVKRARPAIDRLLKERGYGQH